MRQSLKYFIFAIFLIGFNIHSIESLGEDAIIKLLEEIRKRMCHPIPKFGLPALDPFEIKHVELVVDNQYFIDFNGSVTEFRLTGLSDFIINDLKISTNPLKRSVVDVTLPLTAFKSLFTVKGSLAYIVSLAGDGKAAGHVDHLRVSVSWLLKAGFHLGIRGLRIKVTINEIQIDFDKIFEEDRINDFVLALLNELGLELLNDVWQEENSHVEGLVEKKINKFIGQFTLGDILKLIGGGEDPIFGPDDPPGDCKDELLKI